MATFNGSPAGPASGGGKGGSRGKSAAGRRGKRALPRYAIIASRFNEPVVEKLLAGAIDAFERHGITSDNFDVVWVPGAWELPVAARKLLESGRYEALVAVGAVIRGETPHFDYVAGEAAHGLSRVSADFGRPIGFGVLTCDTVEQAQARAGGDHGNKGWDAAAAALEMSDLLRQLDGADAS
jgi:6,7-dimethyl-8-ribityllumazine synthase